MKCPYCGKETEKGKTSFMAWQGFSQMMMSYTPDAEADKGFFKRNTKDRMILSGDEQETLYCPACKKLIITFDAE